MLEISITGNVGTVRFFEKNETQVLSVGVASSRRIGEQNYTDWVSVKIWGKRAVGLRDHILPGQKLFVRGRASTSAYEKGDGSLAAELVCHAEAVEFLGPKPQRAAAEPPPAKAKRARKAMPVGS